MTPFLKQVAQHYLAGETDISKMIFVLPSQRAVVFFRKYLADCVGEMGGKPVIAPAAMPVNQFLGSFSDKVQADQLTLTMELYESYSEICRERGVECETLDDFLFWGGVILSDFDDIDKYLVNAADLLRNVSDYKGMEDDLSYLTENQRKALEAFLHNFETKGPVKMKFARIWDMLGELYVRFNTRLDRKGLTYSGKACREVVRKIEEEGAEAVLHSIYPECGKVVFCGLNALCECEKKILSKLQDLNLAEFCWDYCDDWITNPQNKSSLFLKDFVLQFHNGSFKAEPCGKHPHFDVISVPSGVGQAKFMHSLLSDQDVAPDQTTAVVLPDETLLQPLLNSLPERVTKVNVTMGYSLGGSSFMSLVSDIAMLQLRLRIKDDQAGFYHKMVWSIYTNNIFNLLCSEPERAALAQVKKKRRYYVVGEDLRCGELSSLIFTPVVTDLKTADVSTGKALADYFRKIFNFIGRAIASDEELKKAFALELDFAMESIKSVNLIDDKDLKVLPSTWIGLLLGALRGKSIPLKGEPLSGLQVMGPLETRALDFDRVYILSCNEGVFPRANISPSFVPPLLRAGFGLPTYEYQDAVWAYYFYRLIQRPSNVSLLVDSRTEGLQSGEQSRYIKQLHYHFGADITYKNAFASSSAAELKDTETKTDEDVQKIRQMNFSASMLKQYLECPMAFYYGYVQGLREDDEVEESLGAGSIGNVYHNTMQKLYEAAPGRRVSIEYLEGLLKKECSTIEDTIAGEIISSVSTDQVSGRDLVTQRMIVDWVRRTLIHEIQLLRNAGKMEFELITAEGTLYGDFEGRSLKGRVDRIDSWSPDSVRLVDYKTGKVLKEDIEIDDESAQDIADRIFNVATDNAKRPEIAFQIFFYNLLMETLNIRTRAADSELYARLTDGNVCHVVNSIYSTRAMMTEAPVDVYRNDTFQKVMKEKLSALFAEMESTQVPWSKHVEGYQDNTCKNCSFKKICGR